MNYWKSLVFLVFFASCGDVQITENETLEKALVFGIRDVEQIRGTMSRAKSEPEGSLERAYAYQAAQLARATATITPRRFRATKDPECSIKAAVGSATLTSDSRLTTAYHIVDGAVEDYSAYFESSPKLRKNFNNQYVSDNQGSMELIPPDGGLSGYNQSWESTIFHRSDVLDEESPFLANRLFVLGLDGWSHPFEGKEARKALRSGFRFIIDQVLPGHSGYTPNTVAGQGFVQDFGDSYSGRDMAVLTITRNPAAANLKPLETGNFDIIKPAVFFGKVEMEGVGKHPIKDINFLNHTAPWPHKAKSGIGQFVPLTSFAADYTSLRQQRTISRGSCQGLKPVDITQTALFQTSFDSVQGSSGGIVLTPHSTPNEQNGAPPTLVGIGILTGPSGSDDLDDHRDWAHPYNRTYASSAAAVNITGAFVLDRDIFNRDTIVTPSGNPSKPIPKIEGVYPECLEEMETEDGLVCSRYKTADTATPPSDGLEAPKGIVLIGEDAERVGADVRRRFICDHRIGAPEGVMVGIHGGLALNGIGVSESAETIVDNGGGIGSFMGICAPYSSVSYTDNWRFLSIRGAQMPRELDTLGGPWGWGRFDEYQSRVYEERSVEGHVYVRPPSTKMCPPNYLLKGLNLAIRLKSYLHYTGVRELICVKPQSSTLDIPDEVRVPLAGEESHYSLAGRAFGLSQFIGFPSCGNRRCGETSCLGDTVVRGMETSHDAQGRLTSVVLQCIKSP